MKTIIYIFILTAVFSGMAVTGIYAQKTADNSIEIPCTFVYEFTGTVINEFDSIFDTYLEFNSADLKGIEQIILEDNERKVPYNLNSNNPGITSENGNIYLKVEGINPRPEFFKIKLEGKEGKNYRTRLNIKY